MRPLDSRSLVSPFLKTFRKMSWLLISVIAMGLRIALARAETAQPVVIQSQVQPASVVVGQQAKLVVDVLFRHQMDHPPQVDAPVVEGAQVFRFETQATTLEQQLSGSSYVGQRFEFDIYPRRDGTLIVPATRITLLDTNGVPTKTLSGTAEGLVSKLPPGFSAAERIVAAPSVSMRTTWSRSSKALHVGASATVVVKRVAEGAPGLSFPSLPSMRLDGAQAYPDPPLVEDHVERGDVTGVRTDRATFVFGKAGRFTFPEIVQRWWNTDTRHVATITQPSVTFDVTADAAEVASASLKPRYRFGGGFLAMLLLLVCALAGGAWLRRKRRSSKVTHRHAFDAVLDACKRKDALEAYRTWASLKATRPDLVSDNVIKRDIRQLEETIFLGTPWDSGAAMELHDHLRLKSRWKPKRSKASTTLPALNGA